MDHTKDQPAPLLFNDVYTALAARCMRTGSTGTWAPFPRLPAELRLHIWVLCLRRHRLIDIDLAPEVLPDGSYPFPRYTDRNHLGRVISGGLSYTFALRGRGSYAASLSPLFHVNHEAREVARSFYRIHLPFPGSDQVLYLSPEYDVVYLRSREPKPRPRSPPPDPHVFQVRFPLLYPGFDIILVDFLHDARAYDCKDQGYVP